MKQRQLAFSFAALMLFAVPSDAKEVEQKQQDPVDPSSTRSKAEMESALEPLKIGLSTCASIEKHLNSVGIKFSVWDHGAEGDGTQRYRIKVKRPADNSLNDDLWSRQLFATLEVKDCKLISKDISYSYL